MRSSYCPRCRIRLLPPYPQRPASLSPIRRVSLTRYPFPVQVASIVQWPPTFRPALEGLWTVKVNSGCENLPTLTFSTRIVTAQFRRDGRLATGEIAVTVPMSTSFSEGGSADAPVIGCVGAVFLCADEAQAAKVVSAAKEAASSRRLQKCGPLILL